MANAQEILNMNIPNNNKPFEYIGSERFPCDILTRVKKGCPEWKGFHKDSTIGQMIDLAIIYNCRVIVKNGNKGKWYLKGQGKSIEFLENEISKGLRNNHRIGVYCILLK
jgi:hypothetical protein